MRGLPEPARGGLSGGLPAVPDRVAALTHVLRSPEGERAAISVPAPAGLAGPNGILRRAGALRAGDRVAMR